MHPLFGTELAQLIMQDIHSDAAQHRARVAARPRSGVRRALGRAFIAAGQRLLGV